MTTKRFQFAMGKVFYSDGGKDRKPGWYYQSDMPVGPFESHNFAVLAAQATLPIGSVNPT